MKIADLLVERSILLKRVTFYKFVILLCAIASIYIIFFAKNNVPTKKHEYIGIIRIEDMILENPKIDKMLEDISLDNDIKALIVSINSPGGSSGASEKIYHKLKQIRKKIPIISSIGTVGTSGAYLIALASNRIFALNMSITGSIGVLLQMPEVTELANKLGVKFRNYKSSPLKASPNPMEVPTPEAEEVLMSTITDSHKYFTSLVAKDRNLPIDVATKLSDGRVYTGRQALEAKLVDQIGTTDDAIDWLIESNKFDKNIDIIEIKQRKRNEIMDILIEKFDEQSKSFFSKITSKLIMAF